MYLKSDTVHYQDEAIKYRCFGKVYTASMVKLSSEVNGKIISSNVKLRPGESFRKGDVLVKIYSEDFESSLKAQKSQFISSLSQSLSDILVDFPSEYDKWANFFSKVSVENKLPELPEIKSEQEKIFISVRNILSTYYTLVQQELTLSKYEIKAPFDGVFYSVSKEIGSIATATAEIATLYRTDALEIVAGVDPDFIDFVNVGTDVEIVCGTAENGTESNINGRVDRISSFVDERTQNINVYITLKNRSNMFAGRVYPIDFHSETLKDVYAMPREALTSSNKIFGYRGGKIYALTPDIVYVGEDVIYLRGLEKGTVVISESIVNPYDGMDVNLMK